MRILVAGSSGQLARALKEVAENGPHALYTFGRPEFDLTRPDALKKAIAKMSPDLVINAAAETNVAAAETDLATAMAINAAGAGALARATKAAGGAFIQVSTDYVFDGKGQESLSEFSPPRPLNNYGKSKLAGEQAVAAEHPRSLCIRTAWIYSAYGKNFANTMLDLAQTRAKIEVVDDQIGNPTYAPHLAAALISLAEKALAAPQMTPRILHLAGTGACSWAEFATQIMQESSSLGGAHAQIVPIRSADRDDPVRRPKNSSLDCSVAAETFGLRLPHWQVGTAECIRRCLSERNGETFEGAKA